MIEMTIKTHNVDWIVLKEADWKARKEYHEKALQEWIVPHLRRQELDQRHPVYDFLFTYYSLRPAVLMRWTPGVGVLMDGEGADSFLGCPHYKSFQGGVGLDPDSFPKHRLESVIWILDLLKKTQDRPPVFGCSNLHEWAMEYQNPKPRYPQIPLRLSTDELKSFVSQQEIKCTHYDAFRFFTPVAKPLNSVQPSKKLQPEFEQGGCLHANMDLYKWAYKFHPWIQGELLSEAFQLAVSIREIDMRASPYDLSAFGFEPIKIETSHGRSHYSKIQMEFSERARPIRNRLIIAYEKLINALS